MGTLSYAQGTVEVAIDDRALAHLQIVIGAKLRRHEGFFFTWRDESKDSQRSSIWLHPAIPLQFVLDQPQADISRSWLENLSLSANSPQGLQLTDEPKD